MGLFLSSDRFWLLSVLCSEGKAVLRPVACDRVCGARGRGQGTETVAKLGGFPPSGACVSQRLEAGARGAMMNCETGFLHSLGVWSVPVCRTVENPRGARHWRHFRAAHLYTVGSFDPDHDAVMPAKDLIFSRRIYIYHLMALTNSEQTTIQHEALKSNINVVFRGL